MNIEAYRITFDEPATSWVTPELSAVLKVFPDQHVAETFSMHANALAKDCAASDCGLDIEYTDTYVEAVCGNGACPNPQLKDGLVESMGATISTCVATVDAAEETAVVIRGRAQKYAEAAIEPVARDAETLRREAEEILKPAYARADEIKAMAERAIHNQNFDALQEVRAILRASLGIESE